MRDGDAVMTRKVENEIQTLQRHQPERLAKDAGTWWPFSDPCALTTAPQYECLLLAFMNTAGIHEGQHFIVAELMQRTALTSHAEAGESPPPHEPRGCLDLLTEVGTQRERAVIVQLLVTSPPHRIAHSLYLNLSSKFQSFPICDVRKHEAVLAESCPATGSRRPDNRW